MNWIYYEQELNINDNQIIELEESEFDILVFIFLSWETYWNLFSKHFHSFKIADMMFRKQKSCPSHFKN